MKSAFKTICIVVLLAVFAAPAMASGTPKFTLVKKGPKAAVLRVQNASDLAAFEIEFSIARNQSKPGAQYRVVGVEKGALLKKSTRAFQVLGPRYAADGKVTFGYFSIGAPAGIHGKGTLARIRLKGIPGRLKITGVKATDSKGTVVQCAF